MAFAKISQVAHYVPEQVVTNHDLAQIMDTSDEWISSRTGIKQRRSAVKLPLANRLLATSVAKSLVDSVFEICLCLIPVRLEIHSSLVSMIWAKS